MNDKRRHAIEVIDGKVKFLNRREFDNEIKDFEGRKAWLVIVGRRNTRSQSQNAYYWGVIIDMISKYLGYFPDEMHEILKRKFLPLRTIRLKDEEIVIPESTTKLDSGEFENYLEAIRVWAATDLNLTIPLPNE